MHANDQHLLVIRAIEDADLAALGQAPGRVPQEVMLQLLGAGMFETENLAALRIDAGHHVLNRAVLAGRVHGLKNQQQRIAVGGIQQVLLGAQFFDMFAEQLFVLVFRAIDWLPFGGPLVERDVLARPNTIVVGIDLFHGYIN